MTRWKFFQCLQLFILCYGQNLLHWRRLHGNDDNFNQPPTRFSRCVEYLWNIFLSDSTNNESTHLTLVTVCWIREGFINNACPLLPTHGVGLLHTTRVLINVSQCGNTDTVQICSTVSSFLEMPCVAHITNTYPCLLLLIQCVVNAYFWLYSWRTARFRNFSLIFLCWHTVCAVKMLD